MIDLHTHSTASDGTFQPQQLIEEAVRLGLSALALTDHDTVDGLSEAQTAAKDQQLRFIRGVELNVDWEPGECHILGLGLGEPSSSLAAALDGLAKGRERRNHQIIELMAKSGWQIDYQELKQVSSGKIIGRPHLASVMVAKGYVRSREQAFSTFLAKGRPFYMTRSALSIEQAINAIKTSGGVAILAHPFSLQIAWSQLKKQLITWKGLGLDGIEAYHPSAKLGRCQRLEAFGRSLDLIITAGSDFHGSYRPERSLGYGPAKQAIDERYLAGIP